MLILYCFADYYYDPLPRDEANDSPMTTLVSARINLKADPSRRHFMKVTFGDQKTSRDCLERCLIFIANSFECDSFIDGLQWDTFDCATKGYIK